MAIMFIQYEEHIHSTIDNYQLRIGTVALGREK